MENSITFTPKYKVGDTVYAVLWASEAEKDFFYQNRLGQNCVECVDQFRMQSCDGRYRSPISEKWDLIAGLFQ